MLRTKMKDEIKPQSSRKIDAQVTLGATLRSNFETDAGVKSENESEIKSEIDAEMTLRSKMR